MLVSVETARVVLQYLSEMRTRPRQTASAATGNSGRQAFSEEHKCDASLTKQLLLRLHMKDSMLCSSAVQHLIIRIRSLISTCSNCTEGKAFSAYSFFWVWFWELLPFPDFLGRFASSQAASGSSECSVAASLFLELSLARVSQISQIFVATCIMGVWTRCNRTSWWHSSQCSIGRY